MNVACWALSGLHAIAVESQPLGAKRTRIGLSNAHLCQAASRRRTERALVESRGNDVSEYSIKRHYANRKRLNISCYRRAGCIANSSSRPGRMVLMPP
jgi:hypothetical protein